MVIQPQSSAGTNPTSRHPNLVIYSCWKPTQSYNPHHWLLRESPPTPLSPQTTAKLHLQNTTPRPNSSWGCTPKPWSVHVLLLQSSESNRCLQSVHRHTRMHGLLPPPTRTRQHLCLQTKLLQQESHNLPTAQHRTRSEVYSRCTSQSESRCTTANYISQRRRQPNSKISRSSHTSPGHHTRHITPPRNTHLQSLRRDNHSSRISRLQLHLLHSIQ